MLNSYVPLKLAAEAGAMAPSVPSSCKPVVLLHPATGYGLLISFLFYGVDELMTGYLVFRSRFLPRFLGLLGGIADSATSRTRY